MSRLAEAVPEGFRAAGFRLGKRARRFFAAGLGMTSLTFLGLGIVENPRTAVLALAYLVVGVALYRWFLRLEKIFLERHLRPDEIVATR